MKNISLKKSTFIALLISFSLIAYFIESMLPPIIPGVSGARLGLSNIFVLYALYAFGWKQAVKVAVIKAILGPILAGNPVGIFFSATGTLLSITTMSCLKRMFKDKFGVVGISVAGSLMHNIGQVTAAVILTNTFLVVANLLLLAFLSILCGIITGIAAERLLKLTGNIKLKNKSKSWRNSK